MSRLVQDPRNVITEDVFRLDPALLGTPLAHPWRRTAAMAIDGVLVAILANAPGVLFGLAAALVMFRASARSAGQGYFRKSARLILRFWGAVVLFAVVVNTWDNVGQLSESRFADEEPERSARPRGSAPPPTNLAGLAGLSVAADAIALVSAETEDDARRHAERLVVAMQERGMRSGEIRAVLNDIGSSAEKPWLRAVADSLLQSVEDDVAAGSTSPDSLALQFSAAVSAGDTATAERLGPRLGVALAADTLEELNHDLSQAREQQRSLEAQLERSRRRSGLMSMLGSIAEDLGLGFGWTGLYFTGFLALWNGYTPGKRLLRIRVIRLDGRPMGWWHSFERFGGYAASLATGLLGFFQILWDRNRQGIHDRIAETVVVDASGPDLGGVGFRPVRSLHRAEV